jgi:hypothetical protein
VQSLRSDPVWCRGLFRSPSSCLALAPLWPHPWPPRLGGCKNGFSVVENKWVGEGGRRTLPRYTGLPPWGRSVVLRSFSLRYSLDCVEGKFSEICIQRRAYHAASEPKGSILSASTLDDRLLHVVVLDRYTGSRLLHCRGRLGVDHERFLPSSFAHRQAPSLARRIAFMLSAVAEPIEGVPRLIPL